TYIPLLILFILCVFYHPRLFPTLKIFPWFEYARVPGRSTIIYPTILTLLAIPAFEIPAKRWMKLLYGIILLIGLAELFVNYRFQYNKETYQFADNFREYMDTVKEAPGEAIFDYPFCIVGGNGVGGKEGLASLYVTMSHVSTMQRFHNKKTIGHYYGRLNEFQISQQVALGWGTLLPTKVYDPYTRQKLSACLTTFQFEQLVRFVKYNDFAGINLYTDLLPDKACEQKFISTFGQPTVGTLAPGLGRVIFIPKKTSWFTEIDKVRGKSINFGH
ncbi:MAG: hypothetical protein NWP83_11325, partial [Spirosomaceae bacterium]|nr:hypothetical protein [Spirosomataceae bacterium]